jgi:2-hydroxycyclohexanecarboxyl-CoA dehydrogenase
LGTKAGIDHVVLCIANEFGNNSIRANSISLGLTDTPMTADSASLPGLESVSLPRLESTFVKEYPLGRLGNSQDIVCTTLFLADEHNFITGRNIQVSGSLTLRRNPLVSEATSSIDSN